MSWRLLSTFNPTNTAELKVITIEHHLQTYEFKTLDEAMEWAKQLDEFVTIKFNDLEIAGKFGVDGITSGKFSNGEPYTWKKRRKL
jgi:tRNA(Ile)-lysidine synthase TilS/MesJ